MEVEGGESEKGSTTTTSTTAETTTTAADPAQKLVDEQASMYLDEDPDTQIPTEDNDNDTASSSTPQRDPKEDEAARQARRDKIEAKMKLAEQRYFVRRYKVAQTFILSAAQHLLLDTNASQIQHDFLPHLDSLLEPSPTKKRTVKRKSTLEQQQRQQQPADEPPQPLATSASLQSLEWVQDNDDLQTYLQQLSQSSDPHAGYKCLSWLLFQHLLHDAKTTGYDARIRYWFKTLAVTLWYQQMQSEASAGMSSSSSSSSSSTTTQSKQWLTHATRKFESLEDCCADRLLTLAATSSTANANNGKDMKRTDSQETPKRKSSMGHNIWKGVQIGGVGVGAGILLAVTGGLAAPGIAAGLAALGMGAVAGTFLTLAPSAAVVSLFGVAGGSLAAYKMNRRVSGLTEFTFHQELAPEQDDSDNQQSKAPKSRLFRTIGISGWINDKSDFQRPWGVQPTDPPIQDKVELLQRFYSVHNPDLVPAAEAIWKRHREQPGKLWHLLETKYGCNPDHVFAKENSDNYKNKSSTMPLR